MRAAGTVAHGLVRRCARQAAGGLPIPEEVSAVSAVSAAATPGPASTCFIPGGRARVAASCGSRPGSPGAIGDSRASALLWGGQRRHQTNAAETSKAASSEAGREEPSGKIKTFSDLLEQEDSLSGLFDTYNNGKSLGSLLTRQQLQRRLERAKRLERERAARAGISPAFSRHFEYKGVVPPLAHRIPFAEDIVWSKPRQPPTPKPQTPNATSKVQVLRRVPLSKATEANPLRISTQGPRHYEFAAITALLADAPALYVDCKQFCDSLEPLVMERGIPSDPPGIEAPDGSQQPMDRFHIRDLLEETFTKMLTNRDDLADALDLMLGLSQFCDANGDERIKATFALFDKEAQGRLHFFDVAAVFHHLHRVLLTPFVVDKFRRARVTFHSLDDLAVASTIELFKSKYPYLSSELVKSKGGKSPSDAPEKAAEGSAAAAVCAHNQLFIDLTEEPWKSTAHYAGLFLSYEDFIQVRRNPKDCLDEHSLVAAAASHRQPPRRG